MLRPIHSSGKIFHSLLCKKNLDRCACALQLKGIADWLTPDQLSGTERDLVYACAANRQEFAIALILPVVAVILIYLRNVVFCLTRLQTDCAPGTSLLLPKVECWHLHAPIDLSISQNHLFSLQTTNYDRRLRIY